MESKLNGSRFIKRIVRPPRIAIVVNSLKHVEKFISIASLSWGGRHFLAVPCTDDGKITDDWFDVVKKYNPDIIQTFQELTADTEEKLWKSRFVINKVIELTKVEVEHLYNPPYGPEFIGQPIINFMLKDDFYGDRKNKVKLTYIPLESGFDLYYKARYGTIDKNEWLRWQYVYISPDFRKNNLDEIIENAPLSIEQDILSYIYQNRRHERYDGNPSLLDYTTNGLGHTYIDRLFLDQQPKSETTHIIVVSKEENIDDFCWYWAIRGQRFHPFDTYSKGPIWINHELFKSKLELLQDLFINRNNIYIISKSLSKGDLPTLNKNFSFQQENLQEFYNEHYYIGDTVDVPVNFLDNEAEYKFEPPESLKFLNSSPEQFAMLDIQIPGITLPKVSDFISGRSRVFFWNCRVTKSGLTHIVHWPKEEIIKLTIPTPWDVISTFADAAGYRLEHSDKGRIGDELIRLVGGSKNIWLISHPAIIDLLLEMSNVNKVNEIRKLIRENIGDEEIKNRIISSLPRKSLSRNNMFYSDIKTKLQIEIEGEKLEEKYSKAIIEWLLDNDFLRQGKTIKCDTCFTDNWISINKFDSTIICNGCANEIKNPFGIDKIDWEYEINTLVSAGIDQGLLVHILTGFQIIDRANSLYTKNNIYGSYYGVNFIGDKDGNKKDKEIDIAFIVDSQLVIGECKVSGREFSEEILRENVDFAKEINSSNVILSCFEHVEELERRLKNIELGNIKVTILGKMDLFYQFPGQILAKQFNEEGKDRAPINRFESYKQHLEFLKVEDKKRD